MLNAAKNFGKFLVTPQPQTPLSIGINLTLATAITVGMVMDFAETRRQIKHEENLASNSDK